MSFRLARHRNVGDVAESLTEEDSSEVTAEVTAEPEAVVQLADPVEVAKALQIPTICEPVVEEEREKQTTEKKEPADLSEITVEEVEDKGTFVV